MYGVLFADVPFSILITPVADTRKKKLILCFEGAISNLKLFLQCTILVVFLHVCIDVCVINTALAF